MMSKTKNNELKRNSEIEKKQLYRLNLVKQLKTNIERLCNRKQAHISYRYIKTFKNLQKFFKVYYCNFICIKNSS